MCRSSSTVPQGPQVPSEERSHHSSSDRSAEEIINLKGDQFAGEADVITSLNLNGYDMMALGLTGAIGGHYFAWNTGLSAGFGSFIIALCFISSGFYCLVLCISELSSALPFAGDAYGIARVTLGVFPGYVVAVCDTYKSIIYAASAAYSIGEIITVATGLDRNYDYLWWTLNYAVLLCFHCCGGSTFWRINMGLAILSTIILFIYIFGSIQFADFDHYASFEDKDGINKWFRGGLYQFMHVLPLSTRFFVGIQSINLATGQLKHPKRDVPHGTLGAMTFCLFTSFAVLFLGVSLPPGLDAFIHRPRPLTAGFQAMFALPRDQATLLNLPATFMAGSAFMYFYSQQISAMGKSALLNPWFGNTVSVRNTPIVALVTGTAVSFAMCIAMQYSKESRDAIYDLSVLAAMITYLSIFVSFVMFRWYFPTIQREFISPLGVPGAVYGFLVFFLTLISICGFQQDQIALIVFVVTLAVASIYYYFVVSKRQMFSDEEKTVMFKAYLIKSTYYTVTLPLFSSVF